MVEEVREGLQDLNAFVMVEEAHEGLQKRGIWNGDNAQVRPSGSDTCRYSR